MLFLLCLWGMGSLFKLIAGLALTAAAAVYAAVPSYLVPTGADEARILKEHTINIPIEGCVTASFERAYGILQEADLLDKVQTTYAAQLPSGQTPKFVVHTTGKGQYFYVDKNNGRCDISELWRRTDTNTWFQAAFHVSGKRFFGNFESLIYLTVARQPSASPEVLHYSADVRAWPQLSVARFLIRYLPGIDCYFRAKTSEMRGIITSVFTGIVST